MNTAITTAALGPSLQTEHTSFLPMISADPPSSDQVPYEHTHLNRLTQEHHSLAPLVPLVGGPVRPGTCIFWADKYALRTSLVLMRLRGGRLDDHDSISIIPHFATLNLMYVVRQTQVCTDFDDFTPSRSV